MLILGIIGDIGKIGLGYKLGADNRDTKIGVIPARVLVAFASQAHVL